MSGSPALGQRTARWSEPDAVFENLFSATEQPDLAPGGICTCPACDGDDEPISLPVLRPCPDEELSAVAAATALVARACALARWLGEGRRLTPAKVLRPAEAVAAVAELGLDRPVLPIGEALAAVDLRPFGRAAGSKGPRARSAKHMPDLQPIWSAAVEAGLIELRGQKAVPGAALALWSRTAPAAAAADAADAAEHDTGTATRHRRLDCWARLVAGYLRAQAELERADQLWFAGPAQLLLPTSALLLYTADDAPLTPATLVMGALFAAQDDDEFDPMLLLTLPAQVARWAEVVDAWATVGVVTPVGGGPAGGDPAAAGDLPPITAELAAELEPLVAQLREVFPAGMPALEPLLDSLRQGPVVTVSPGGHDLLARVLRGQGFTVPTVGDLADTPPGELLMAISGHDPVAAAEEIRGWLDARGQDWQTALDELVASASGKDEDGPLRRTALPIVIALASRVASSMIPTWQEDPWLAVPVALGLAAASGASRPQPEHLLWMAVDLLSVGLDDDDMLADLADATGVAELLAAPGAVTVAVGLDHPHTREVLRLLVEHLDDRALAGRLRKALAAGGTRRTPKARRPSTPPLRGL